eukprot:1852747-Rhodomonas_salina.1
MATSRSPAATRTCQVLLSCFNARFLPLALFPFFLARSRSQALALCRWLVADFPYGAMQRAVQAYDMVLRDA